MARRDLGILTAIGHMLAGAGSDKAQITLTHAQVEQLGLLNHKGKAVITHLGGLDEEGKLTMEPTDKEVPAVVSHGENLSGFTVVVGVARAALKKAMRGQPIEGMLRPDDGSALLPPPEEEETEDLEETEAPKSPASK